jgi:oligo-1,6-glucosidase
MLDIRRNNLDLIYGKYEDIDPEHQQIFAYTRTGKDTTYLVILNMSDQQVNYAPGEKFDNYKLCLSNQSTQYKLIDAGSVQLNPWEAQLYKSTSLNPIHGLSD